MKPTVQMLIRKKLLWGVVIIVVTQVLGMLPALDFLPSIWLKIVSFSLGVFLTAAKGMEMFFEKTAEFEESVDSVTVSTTVTTKSETPVEQTKI